MNALQSRDDVVAFLVDRRFPLARHMRASSSIGGTGNVSPNRHQILKDATEFEASLRALPDDKLAERVKIEIDQQAAEQRAKFEAQERAIVYNRPTAAANIEHWASLDYWTLDEAVALSFGKDPKVVNPTALKPYRDLGGLPPAFADRREMAQRATVAGLLFDPVLPGFFLAWAERKQIVLPPALVAEVKARGHAIADWKSRYDELAKRYDEVLGFNTDLAKGVDELVAERNALKTKVDELRQLLEAQPAPDRALHPSVRRSLFKMILGMAIDKFHFKAEAQKNAATAKIADALQRHGIRLDADTVRKRLQEAAEEVEAETEKSA